MGKRIDSLSIRYTEADIIDFAIWIQASKDKFSKSQLKTLFDLYMEHKQYEL